MSLIRRNSGHEVPAFFNDFFTRDLWNWGLENGSASGTTLPAVNIRENNEEFIVEMAAPGMTKDDFKVQLDGNTLTITSEKSNEQEDNSGETNYRRKEFSYQSFTRTLQLQKDVVDADKIEARYENGVLKLNIPKKEEAKQKPPRTIQIA